MAAPTLLTSGPAAPLYPAVAEAARRAGAETVGLVAVGATDRSALHLDRLDLRYGDGRGGDETTCGDAGSPVRQSCQLRGSRPVPERGIPPVVARIALDRAPADPSEVERQLGAAGPQLIAGDLVDQVPDAVAAVPAPALPVVLTAWTLAGLSPARRLAFLRRLDAAATGRAVAWVSAEGVGVAPAIPTLGDRRASGHSIVGVAIVEHGRLRTQAVARCWSRGRFLAWLA